MLLEDAVLAPGNEARSHQYKMTKAQFVDHQDRRVYRFHRKALETLSKGLR